MTDFNANRYSDEELHAEFDRLFPRGFAGTDVVQELTPHGWENSKLAAVFHPSVEQSYEEALQIHRNLISLRRPNDQRPVSPEPTLEEIVREHCPKPVDADREIRELVGQSLWDVFSDNHEVIGPGARVLDLGSFRASGGFIADVLNRQIGTEEYDYINFYMGTIWVAQRADLTPVYRLIFRRLRDRGFNWAYHFPRLYAVDMRPLKEALDRDKEPEWTNYDPSESLAKEEADREHDENLAELRDSLDDGHQSAIEEALQAPPPPTVRAYQSVYGRLPEGWPPVP
jgi:hypothetical protein